MKLSFVVPAYNEELLLANCLRSIRDGLAANQVGDHEHEIIVVDNNSTDSTAVIAHEAGVTVVTEAVNQIARARNAGASAASGDWLIFIDADSEIPAELLGDILALVCRDDVVAAGATMDMGDVPWWAAATMRLWLWLSKTMRWAAGSLFVCRRDAFDELGGFDQSLYAAEEIDLSQRLKRWGRPRRLSLEILSDHPLKTSDRKLKLYSGGEIAGQFLRLALRPRRALRDRSKLAVWYDGRR